MRMKGQNELDSCGLCIKYLMFTMNIVFFMIGAAIVGVCLWILLDQNYMSILFGTPLMTASTYTVIVGGCIILVISFFGCCGAINLNKCMLMTYFIMMLVILVALVTGAILAIVFRTQIGQHVWVSMEESITKTYGVELGNPYNRAITEAWDKTQMRLRCCAVRDNGFSIYWGSKWFDNQSGLPNSNRPRIPESCCARDQYDEIRHKEYCQTNSNGPPTLPAGTNPYMYMSGCYNVGREYVFEYTAALIGIGIGVGLLMVVGMIFSLMLYRYIED